MANSPAPSFLPVPCLRCGQPLEASMPSFEGETDNLPADATVFTSHGNYGSTVFDPMDSSTLIVNVCDSCLLKAQAEGRVLFSPRPPLPPSPVLKLWDGYAPESTPPSPLPGPSTLPQLIEPVDSQDLAAHQIHAPFNQDQVASLNAFQQSGAFHPFTCAKGSHTLVATPEGWTCPQDDYTQDWAHDFMSDWSWKELAFTW